MFRDAFRLACRRGTELVNPTNYNYSRLDRDSVLLLNEGHCLREHAISACRLKSAEKISPFQASSLLTLIEMVDADLLAEKAAAARKAKAEARKGRSNEVEQASAAIEHDQDDGDSR